MPIMDGFEATRIINKMYNNDEIDSLPYLVCLTAYSSEEIKK
jgi:CheY-like chemotaxis protein